MKSDAKIRWNIDDTEHGIDSGSIEVVVVDDDYNSSVDEIATYIEDELYAKYKTMFYMSIREGEGDFDVLNMDELLDAAD